MNTVEGFPRRAHFVLGGVPPCITHNMAKADEPAEAFGLLLIECEGGPKNCIRSAIKVDLQSLLVSYRWQFPVCDQPYLIIFNGLFNATAGERE